ncbi:hypothetical protein ACFL6T_06485 [Candidatus Zixiibacteriota bacterium]
MLTFNLGVKSTAVSTGDAGDTKPAEVDKTVVESGDELRAASPKKVDGD